MSKRRSKKKKKRNTPNNLQNNTPKKRRKIPLGIKIAVPIIVTILLFILGIGWDTLLFYAEGCRSEKIEKMSLAHEFRPELKVLPIVRVDSFWYNAKEQDFIKREIITSDTKGSYGVTLTLFVTNFGRGTATFLDSWAGCSENDLMFRDILTNDSLRPLAVKKSKSKKLLFPKTSIMKEDTMSVTFVMDTLCIAEGKTKLQFYFSYYSDYKIVYDLYYWALYKPNNMWFNNKDYKMYGFSYKSYGGSQDMQFIQDNYNPEVYDENVSEKILEDYGVVP